MPFVMFILFSQIIFQSAAPQRKGGSSNSATPLKNASLRRETDGQVTKIVGTLHIRFCASDENIDISTATNKSDMLFFLVLIDLQNAQI